MALKYRYVLFDLDGTVTDSAPGILNSGEYALKRILGSTPPREAMRRMIGPPLTESMHEYFGVPLNRVDEAIRLYREYYLTKGIYENELYPGIRETLFALKDLGAVPCLASAKPEFMVEKVLKHFGLDKVFEVAAGGSDGPDGGNKRVIIGNVMRRAGFSDPREGVMVGDRIFDIRGAREAGMDSVGVLYGYGSEEELAGAGADMLAKDAASLLSLLTEV